MLGGKSHFAPFLAFLLLVHEVDPGLISLIECDYVKFCHKQPPACKSNLDCDLIVTWQQNKTNPSVAVYFEVATKKSSGHRWIANALNVVAGRMAGSSGEVCMFDGMTGTLRGFKATARGIAPEYYDQVEGLMLHNIELVDDTLICRYSRFIQPPAGYMKPLNESYFVVNVFGQHLQNNVEVVQHNRGDYRYTASQVQISPFLHKTPLLCLSDDFDELTYYCVLELSTEIHMCTYVKPAQQHLTTTVSSSLTIVTTQTTQVPVRSATMFSTILSSNVYTCIFSTSREVSSSTTSSSTPTEVTTSAVVIPTTVTVGRLLVTGTSAVTRSTPVLNSAPSSMIKSASVQNSPSVREIKLSTSSLPAVMTSLVEADCFWDTCKSTDQIALKSHGRTISHQHAVLVLLGFVVYVVSWIETDGMM